MATDLQNAQSRQALLATLQGTVTNVDTAAAALRTALLNYKAALDALAGSGVDANTLRAVGDGASAQAALLAAMNLPGIFTGPATDRAAGPTFGSTLAPHLRLSGRDEALIAGNTTLAAQIASNPAGASGSTVYAPPPIPPNLA